MKRKGSPDTTARIPRTQMQAYAKAASAGRFVWPAPPYFEFAERADHAECVLLFRNGAKASGVLIEFLADDEVLTFRAEKAAEPSSIAFSALVGVQLRRPIPLRRQSMLMDDTAELFAASERQPFVVHLVNGKTFKGETVGCVQARCGLFLFPPERDVSVTRWFVPTSAVQSTDMGKPIGQMLIEEKLASSESVEAALSRQQALRARRFGEYLVEHQIVTPEQLAAALRQQSAQPVHKVGETLVELGYLTGAELQEALAIEARDRTIPLGHPDGREVPPRHHSSAGHKIAGRSESDMFRRRCE